MDIDISDSGLELLQREYREYRAIFEDEARVTVSGAVCSGSGQGKEYIQLDGYMQQFEQKLGYRPYPGTFNVEISAPDIPARQRLGAFDAVPIEEWEDDGQSYGSASCYPATVSTSSGSVEAHVLEPDRTHHGEEYIELVAPERLRESLDVTDGDEISITISSTRAGNL
jgi:riboflavin kinase